MKRGMCAVLTLLGALTVAGGAGAQPVPRPTPEPAPELSPQPEDGSAGLNEGLVGRSFVLSGLPDCPVGETEVFLFFLGFTNAQRGVNANVVLGPGETAECATRDPEPTGIFVVNTDAATGDFEGSGGSIRRQRR